MENEQVIRILKKLIKIAEQEKQKHSDLGFCLAFADERIEAYTMAIDALERQGKKLAVDVWKKVSMKMKSIMDIRLHVQFASADVTIITKNRRGRNAGVEIVSVLRGKCKYSIIEQRTTETLVCYKRQR